MRYVTTAAGYVAARDARVLFGLGAEEEASRLVVRWPSGVVDVVESPPLNRYLLVEEGSGLVSDERAGEAGS